MEKVFDSVKELDRRAEETFCLNHGILMEQAARGMAEYIRRYIDSQGIIAQRNPCVQIVCGAGDNGGDGFALARMLADFCTVRTVSVQEPKSLLCKMQRERLALLGIPVYTEIISSCDVLVDAILGTGIHGTLHNQICALIKQLNAVHAYKIACDIPSGLNEYGIPVPEAFRADATCTMGALKTALYSDTAKDYTGTIHLVNLGLPRSCYEGETATFLLSADDMKLPHRILQNTHKMTYGQSLFFAGEKTGACVLAACAALRFGSGLVTVYGEPLPASPPDIMYTATLPASFSAVSIGSGLGRIPTQQQKALEFLQYEAVRSKPLILDADILHNEALPALLPALKHPILTPHPKEFQSLLKNSELAQLDIQTIQERRFFYLRLFCEAFPHLTVVLKGAYSLIGSGGKIFVNPLGSNALAKAGTGDVLTGMITALTAQGYTPLEAACTASLAHAAGAHGGGYGLLASDLVLRIANLS